MVSDTDRVSSLFAEPLDVLIDTWRNNGPMARRTLEMTTGMGKTWKRILTMQLLPEVNTERCTLYQPLSQSGQ